jgi:hypothetical protein
VKPKRFADSSNYVKDSEKLKFLEHRKVLGDFRKIVGRKIFLQKTSVNLSMTIFEGNHEMLKEIALNQLIRE